MSTSFDIQETLQRIMKYLIEGLVIGLVAYLLPSKSLSTEEIIMLALTAASIFALLDVLAPSISSTVRSGVGYGIGFQLAGFP
jgi:hypothetical protein